jgi:hypothetical protein
MGILFAVIDDEGHEETFEYMPQGHESATNQQKLECEIEAK